MGEGHNTHYTILILIGALLLIFALSCRWCFDWPNSIVQTAARVVHLPEAVQRGEAPPVYQGGPPVYQGGPSAPPGGAPPVYQGVPPVYQGGPPVYQGGPPVYQGGPSAQPGGPPVYQGGPSAQPGGPPVYKGAPPTPVHSAFFVQQLPEAPPPPYRDCQTAEEPPAKDEECSGNSFQSTRKSYLN